jgi:hypothetical protein
LGELTEKAAAQTVRTVALIGGAEALDLLARYADDARGKVVDALIEAWGYFDADAYADRVLAGLPLKDRRVTVTHSAQLRAVARLPAVDDLWVNSPVTDLTFLTELHPLTQLAFADLRGEVDLSELASQTSLEHLLLLGGPSLETFNGLWFPPALLTLYLSCYRVTDLGAVCLPTALRSLGLLSVDASLDLGRLRHDQIVWLGLVMREFSVPRGVEALTGLTQLEFLYLNRVDVAAWLKSSGAVPPPTVKDLRLEDCVLPDDPSAIHIPGAKLTIL